jgi:hypothetical protein
MEVMEGGDSGPKRMTIVKSHDVIKIVRYSHLSLTNFINIALTTKPSM